ncbi:MAG TPA: hypothetical protein VHF89_19920 [Solirubrobacteraceae bacterium]|nr:hypothetical protein [Solirubrobacteraceae bacterium]
MHRIQIRGALLALALLVVVGAPFAVAAGEGRPLEGGVRNPGFDESLELTRETEIIADTSTYGTRQSNKSDNGGGAIYGCRSGQGGTPARNEPCIRSNNLSTGLSFEFASGGTLAGTITTRVAGDGARPLTTNATGVATGLNADEVDGRSADDFLARDGKATDADRLDGRDSDSFASAGDLAFAAVTSDARTTGRGVTGATLADSTNTFTVTFDRDVSKCSYTATESGDAASGVTFAVSPAPGDARSVRVDEDNDGAAAVPFHLQVVC